MRDAQAEGPRDVREASEGVRLPLTLLLLVPPLAPLLRSAAAGPDAACPALSRLQVIRFLGALDRELLGARQPQGLGGDLPGLGAPLVRP